MNQAIKVYQIAEALGMDYDTVVAKIRAFGIPVNNKMSKIDGDVAEQIKSSLLKDKQQDWVEIDLGNGVRKRVRKAPVASDKPVAPAEAAPRAAAPARETAVESAPRATEDVARPAPSSAAPPSSPPESAPRAVTPVPERTEPVETPAPPPASTAPAPEAPVRTREAKQPPAARSTESAVPARTEPEAPAPSPREAAPSSAPVTPPATPAAPPPTASAPTPRAAEPAPRAAQPAASPTPPAVAQERVPEAPAPREAATPARSEEAPRAESPARAESSIPAPSREAPVPASSSAGSEAAQPASAPPSPTPSVAPPAAGAKPAGATPSIPPPQKKGIATWDPVTKQVIYNEPPKSRSVQVDPSRFQNRGPAGTRAVPGQRPGGMGAGRPPMGTRGRPGFRSNLPKGPAPIPTVMGAHKRIVKIESTIALQELARRMSVKAGEVLMKLLQMGMTGVNINTTLDSDTAKLIAQEFQYEVEDVAVNEDEGLAAIVPAFTDDPIDHITRPPVVTVMGHVDHGKTTLLDAIIGQKVAEGEAGGITQKVSAYRVETKVGPVVFFDTPGHEAFTKLRARGAETTDVAVIVVAADDGVMPTTVEAINHVKMAGVPIVVAMNKIDKPDAKPERVMQQLMEHDVIPEQFGGEVLVVPVSAKQRTNIEKLVESLALQSEILELKANPKRPGHGTVFDATLDKGRGVVARVLVQDGTVRAGDVVVAGSAFGKIRAMFDDRGKAISKAGPSVPIEVLGLNELPNAGDTFSVVQDLKKAQAFSEERKGKMAAKATTGGPGTPGFPDINALIREGETITVGVILKAEAQGSVEALTKALQELSTDKVKIQIVHTGIGGITESDVNLAVASKFLTVVIGFNVRPQGKAAQLAETEKVQVRLYNIIYEAVDDLKLLMVGQLKPNLVQKPLGKAEVRQVFNITKVGQIAGCYVTEGQIKRTARARLVRDSVQIWEGKLSSLKRFKDDIREVANGFECGIGLENYNDIKPGDVIEAFEIEEIAAVL